MKIRDIVFSIMITILILTVAKTAIAKEYPSIYRGIRPLGMGNAFTAVADDENALFYNPAGLSKMSTVQLGLLNPLIEVSKKSIELWQDAQDIDMNDTGQVADLLKKYTGEHQHLRVSLFPHIGFKALGAGVMIGGLGQGTMDVEVRNPVWPEVDTDLVLDVGALGGAGFKLPLTGLRAGIALKYLYRKSLSEVYTAADIAGDFEDILDRDLKSGSGVSADIGLMYDLAFIKLFDTTVALVAQNVPKMDMGDAKDIKTQFNAGISLKKSFAGFGALLALDYRDITSNIGDDDDIPKRIHMGAEVKLPKILALRGGINQGYLTAGATVDFWVLRFDVATYAEEAGAYAGQREDRRYVGQITLGW